MRVIVAEKPSVGRDLARVLGNPKAKDGHIQCGDDIVTWGFGHLCEIAEPGDMDPRWGDKKWSLDVLPMIPDEFKLKIRKGASKQFKVVKDLLRKADSIVNAADAGREGELIFRWIYKMAGAKAPVQRLWISDLTDQSIKDGFKKLHPGTDFDNPAAAGESRAYADWLTGLNATRAYTVRNGVMCTVGRVQSPTLAMIVEREHAITSFEARAFWKVQALVGQDTFTVENNDKNRFWERSEAINISGVLSGKVATIDKVETKEESIPAPQLFDITSLQKECNKRFGFSAKRTLELAQELYETYKVLSYPRSECRHLSKNMKGDLSAVIEACAVSQPDAAKSAQKHWKKNNSLSKRYMDDTKLTDHHAIIPTKTPKPEGLKGDAEQVYDLVVSRFLSIFLPNRLERTLCVRLSAEGHSLTASGKAVTDPGWSTVWDLGKKKEQWLEGTYAEGERVALDEVTVKEGKTEPPKRFTEGTLLDAMKNAANRVDDKSLAGMMRDCGLGTGATRASIIERLFQTKYLVRKGKELLPTDKGKALVAVLVGELADPKLTGAWELLLHDVEDGKLTADQFMTSITDFVEGLIAAIAKSPVFETPEAELKVIGSCPTCGSSVVAKSKGYFCETKECTAIWKTIASRKIKEKEATQLLQDGRVTLSGFKSKLGKAFSANLVLEGARVKMEFGERKTVGACPKCGSDVVELDFGYGCDGFKKGCKVLIPKELCGSVLSANVAAQLLKGSESEVLKGFVSKAGKNFSAKLKLSDDGGRIEFIFPQKAAV